MKMDKATIEIILFDSGDIIATSGGVIPVPTTIGIIFLTPDSANNYNEMVSVGEFHINDDGIEPNTTYLGYTGAFSNGGKYGVSTWAREGQYTSLTAEQQKGIMNVEAGNRDQYNAVLQWLNANYKVQ